MLGTCFRRAALGVGRPVLVACCCLRAMEAVERNLRAYFSTHACTPVSNKFASVLVPLYEDEAGEVQVVLTQRSPKLPTHSGEVCLPGGKRDPGDRDDVATALREAHEELGIDPAAVHVLGRLPCFLSKHLLSVTPVVGVIPPDLRFRPNTGEVASVFSAPLRLFLEGGPDHYTRDLEWQEGMPYRLHYWRYRYGREQYLIWGLTAGILITAAERAFARAPDFEVTPPGVPEYTQLYYDGEKLAYRAGYAVRPVGEAAAAAAAMAAAVPPAQVPAALRSALARARQPGMMQAAALHTTAAGPQPGAAAAPEAGAQSGSETDPLEATLES